MEADQKAATIAADITPNELELVEALRSLPPGGTILITRNGRNSDVEYFMETTEKRLLKSTPRTREPKE